MGVRNRRIEQNDPPVFAELDKIIKKAIRGDNDALYALCERIAGRVLFLASCMLRDPGDAEDVSQEALIRVCEGIGNLRDSAAFGGWLSKIVINEARLHIRKSASHGIVVNIEDYIESLTEKDEALLPQEYAENREIRQFVQEIIQNLPLRQREAILLHYYGGLRVNEVADVMGIEHQSVSKQLAVAREKIRREIENRTLGNERVHSVVALPVSQLLANLLEIESTGGTLPNAVWTQHVLTKCQEAIQAKTASPVEAVAAKALFFPIMGIASVAVFVGGLLLDASFNGVPPLMQSVPDTRITGEISFSGGKDQGGNRIYLNPSSAYPNAVGANGEITVLEWYITPERGEMRLYGDQGADASGALRLLRENEGDGKYDLYFLFQDEAGVVSRMHSNFRIDNNGSEFVPVP